MMMSLSGLASGTVLAGMGANSTRGAGRIFDALEARGVERMAALVCGASSAVGGRVLAVVSGVGAAAIAQVVRGNNPK